MFLFQDKFYDEWFRCWVIVSKMNILTDNGTWEYKRLSDKFTDNNCKFDDDINSYIQSM